MWSCAGIRRESEQTETHPGYTAPQSGEAD